MMRPVQKEVPPPFRGTAGDHGRRSMRTIPADRLTVPGGELLWTTEVSHGLILAPGWLQATPRGPGRASADAHYIAVCPVPGPLACAAWYVRSGSGHCGVVTLNPSAQYADDRNLRARQRFWQYQDPYFDMVGWVMDLARLSPGLRVLDAGCGNGAYLRALRDRQAVAVGCDLSLGMLRAAAHPALLNADVTALPLRDGAVDVALAIHMLYHVPSREAAIGELRRVVAAGGTCIAVTNGRRHTRSLRALVERAVRQETPGWQMRPATCAFTAENAAAQLGNAFEIVTCVRPASNPPVVIRDAAVAAGYLASLASHHQGETVRPWDDVVEDVRQQVQAVIDDKGAFITCGDLAAFICR